MEEQELKRKAELEKLQNSSPGFKFDNYSSSEDDEDFIRQSVININKRFSVVNNEYFENVFANRTPKTVSHETDEPKHTVMLGSKEVSSDLSNVFDALNKLNYDVQDKDDRLFTNLDTFLFYLEVSDIIQLQQCSRAFYRMFDNEQLKRLVRVGNLDDDLRPKFWIHKCPFFSFQNEVRDQLGEVGLFSNVYEIILSKRETDPIPFKTKDEIGRDLPRTFTADGILNGKPPLTIIISLYR